MSNPEMNTAGQERAEKILEARQSVKKSEGRYRIIEMVDTVINQTIYIPQKKNWLGIWRDMSYGKILIESAEDDIRKDKGEFKIVKYM